MRLSMGLTRRLLSLLLSLVCLLGMILPAAAVKAPRLEPKIKTVTTARIHLSTGSRSRVIGQLEDGTVLTVLDKAGSYYRIDCHEMTGYIAAELVACEDEKYYVNCKDGHSDVKVQNLLSISDTLTVRDRLLELAKAQLGAPYIYGRSAPGGFDCSGFTSYLYRTVGLPVTRCADDQMQDGLVVDRNSLQIGDLVFFRESWSPWIASHVGIYVGNGKMIHADSRGVRYDSVLEGHYGALYVGARRIIQTEAVTVDALPTAADQSPMGRSISGLRTVG